MTNIPNPYSGDCEFTEFLQQRSAAREADFAGNLSRIECLAKARKVKLLLLDVDGVLTDGSIVYTHSGDEIKSFNCRDGFGINIVRKAGVEVGIITARRSEALTRRIGDLGLTHVYQGCRNKVEVFRKIVAELDLESSETAFMGDDWLDLSLLNRVGFSATVADGVPELKQTVHYISSCNGGKGAVRDLCDFIIEAKGKHRELLAEYANRQ